jgi:hypothetical protein
MAPIAPMPRSTIALPVEMRIGELDTAVLSCVVLPSLNQESK